MIHAKFCKADQSVDSPSRVFISFPQDLITQFTVSWSVKAEGKKNRKKKNTKPSSPLINQSVPLSNKDKIMEPLHEVLFATVILTSVMAQYLIQRQDEKSHLKFLVGKVI